MMQNINKKDNILILLIRIQFFFGSAERKWQYRVSAAVGSIETSETMVNAMVKCYGKPTGTYRKTSAHTRGRRLPPKTLSLVFAYTLEKGNKLLRIGRGRKKNDFNNGAGVPVFRCQCSDRYASAFFYSKRFVRSNVASALGSISACIRRTPRRALGTGI